MPQRHRRVDITKFQWVQLTQPGTGNIADFWISNKAETPIYWIYDAAIPPYDANGQINKIDQERAETLNVGEAMQRIEIATDAHVFAYTTTDSYVIIVDDY